jgi:hypothetical protein
MAEAHRVRGFSITQISPRAPDRSITVRVKTDMRVETTRHCAQRWRSVITQLKSMNQSNRLQQTERQQASRLKRIV